MRGVLRDPALDPAFKELVLTLPSETYIAEQLASVDPQRIHARARGDARAARQRLARRLGMGLRDAPGERRLLARPRVGRAGARSPTWRWRCSACDAVERSDAVWPGRAYQRFKDAGNMTDRLGALAALARLPARRSPPTRSSASSRCSRTRRWWSTSGSRCRRRRPSATATCSSASRRCCAHRDFSLANPNRARSLIVTFVLANPAGFHRADARRLRVLGRARARARPHQPAAGVALARALDRWSQLAEPYRSGAREAIARVAAAPDLSCDTSEIVTRALAIA